MIKHTWLLCFSFELRSGERRSSIFRGKEARSGERPTKVSTKTEEGKKQNGSSVEAGIGWKYANESYLLLN